MISPPVAVAICVVLAALGGLILLAIGGVGILLAVRKLKGKKGAPAPVSTSGSILPGLFGGSSGASPLVQELEKVVVQAVHGHAQAALNNAAAQFLPGLKPFIPLIEKVAGDVAQAAPVPAPTPPVPTVSIAQGHPKYNDVVKLLQADQPATKAA